MKPVVKIEHGPNGWGGPLIVCETETQNVVASVTGGGIHPIAQRIADLLKVPAVDGFKNKVNPENIIVAVVDCGGTARCGVYPKMGVKTIDVLPIGPSGPLAKFINEENFCSGVDPADIKLIEGIEAENAANEAQAESAVIASETSASAAITQTSSSEEKGIMGAISKMGRAVGGVVNTFYQAARDTLDIVIKESVKLFL